MQTHNAHCLLLKAASELFVFRAYLSRAPYQALGLARSSSWEEVVQGEILARIGRSPATSQSDGYTTFLGTIVVCGERFATSVSFGRR